MMLKLLTNCVLVSFVTEYGWSQAEPALAIICACIITYRPLFTNVIVNLSKVSVIFSRSFHGKVKGSESDEIYGDGSNLYWPGTKDNRLERLNAKSANQNLHVVRIDLSTIPGSRSFRGK